MNRRMLLNVGVPVVVAAGLLIYGIVGRERALSALARVANEEAILPVEIISPQPGPSTRPLILPGTVRAWYEALIFRAAGTQVAIVDGSNRVHMRNVMLGQNLGQTVQVTSGLSAGERLVNNPPAGLLEGQTVQPVTPVPGYATVKQTLHTLPEPPPPPGSVTGDGHATTP